MSVNPITTDATAFTLKPLSTTLSVDQSTKTVPSANDQLSNKTLQPSVVDTNNDNKVNAAARQTPDASAANQNKPVREMSHVIEVYNQKGKVRIKFVDSHNNVIYQIPSEMVAKMEDQMMKPETSTDVKG